MSNEYLQEYFVNRSEAKWELSDEFTDSRDKRDALFLLTAVMVAQDMLLGRKGVKEFFDYAIDKDHQREILALAREFDEAIGAFNKTADGEIDSALANTISVRENGKLGNGRIPLFLGEHQVRPREAVAQIEAGIDAFVAQDKYMENSENLGDAAQESGEWSELHLNAKSPKHFLGTFMVDLYPGMLRRWLQSTEADKNKHEDLDTDELVRALCENISPNSELFRLINDQGWFNDDTFSEEFRARLPK